MFNGWTWFKSKAAAEAADPARGGVQSDYWTNAEGSAWHDTNGVAWVLTYCKGTNELMLFGQSDESVGAWVSPVWGLQDEAESVLEGFASAGGDWSWLSSRLDR
jgi:hypothetical protein